MHIKVDKEKISGNFSVEVRLEGVETEEFKEAVKRNGNPECDLGGLFTETTTDEDTNEEITVEFKLNNNIRKIPTDLPYTRVFKTSQYGENAKNYADLYAKTVKSRLDIELAKINIEDDFSDKDLNVIF